MRNKLLAVFCYTVFALLVLPYLVTAYCAKSPGGEPLPAASLPASAEQPPTYAEQASTLGQAFETYLIGVVAAEMPALFEEEALKAQAVAARTYALREIEASGATEPPYTTGQAYLTADALRNQWGEQFDAYYARVSGAVAATAGEILTYNDEPILAVFHSTSAGYTESADNVWSQDLPYLQSVASVGDESAPGFETTLRIPCATVVATLKALHPDLVLSTQNLAGQLQILERTDAGYVKTMQVGNLTLTGRQVREALGLRSSHFTFAEDSGDLVFITRGFGHGAGMSQYGANYLAQNGYTYDQILSYYYQGATLTKMQSP